MVLILENRATQAAALPPWSNATVTAGLDAAATFAEWLTQGGPAWSHYNRRRADLIRRKVRQTLTTSEEEELKWLQEATLAAVDRAFPRPPIDLGFLETLKRDLEDRARQEKS